MQRGRFIDGHRDRTGGRPNRRLRRQGVLLAFLVLLGVHAVHADDVRTTKDRPYPERFRTRVRDGIARALETLHEQTQRPLWIHDDADRFVWSADVLHAFRREGRGLELQADEEIRARLARHKPATVEEASLLILALCARSLPDRDPFSKQAAPRIDLTEQDLALVKRTVERLLHAQVMETTRPPGGEREPREDLRRSGDHGGWSALAALDEVGSSSADMRGTGSALIALEAAANAGVAVPPERFLAALELLLRWQATEGEADRVRLGVVEGDRHRAWSAAARARGWGWTGARAARPEGDATANGVLGLAVCRAVLAEHPGYRPLLSARTDLGIRDGLAWIQRHFDARKCPDPQHAAPPGANLSARNTWLLRLGQIGAHLGVRQVGSHDLYLEAAEVVLKEQQDDGMPRTSWHRPVAPLLVLLRAGPDPATILPFLPAEAGD